MTDGLRTWMAGLALGLWACTAQAADSAVVLMYQRFDDPRVPTANTRLDQLDAHIAELKGGGYAVWPLPRVLAAQAAGEDLPDRLIAITIDDARANVYRSIWPRLKAARLPFTLFIATDEIDRGAAGDFMTWDQVREVQQSGLVTIGSLGAAHAHYPALTRAAIADDLKRAADRFAVELPNGPTVMAWPFGEMSRDGADAIAAAGFVAAFGQHSGAIWAGADRLFLPRFGLNETYGEIERFRLAARALALPAVDVTPDDPKLGANPPNFGFTLARDVPGAELLACYASHEGRVRTESLGPRIEVRMTKPFPTGRGRINCTIPTLDGRWRWFGWQFSVN